MLVRKIKQKHNRFKTTFKTKKLDQTEKMTQLCLNENSWINPTFESDECLKFVYQFLKISKEYLESFHPEAAAISARESRFLQITVKT